MYMGSGQFCRCNVMSPGKADPRAGADAHCGGGRRIQLPHTAAQPQGAHPCVPGPGPGGAVQPPAAALRPAPKRADARCASVPTWSTSGKYVSCKLACPAQCGASHLRPLVLSFEGHRAASDTQQCTIRTRTCASQRGLPVGRFSARWMRQNRPQAPQPSGRSSPLSMQLRGRRFCCAGSAATPPGQPPEEKSVLQALQDLGSHFGREGSFGAAPAAAAAPTADAEPDLEPPRPRIGKVQYVTSSWHIAALASCKDLALHLLAALAC